MRVVLMPINYFDDSLEGSSADKVLLQHSNAEEEKRSSSSVQRMEYAN